MKGFSILYRTVFVVFFFILSMVSFAACVTDNRDSISDEGGTMNIEIGENGVIRNGTEHYTYRVEEGYQGVVSVNISKKSGRIDLDIYPTDRKEETEYKGRELDSSAFSVILTKSGEYKIRITAKDFVGDYGISWKTEETEEKEVCSVR